MFSTHSSKTGFAKVPCPRESDCDLPFCMFAHSNAMKLLNGGQRSLKNEDGMTDRKVIALGANQGEQVKPKAELPQTKRATSTGNPPSSLVSTLLAPQVDSSPVLKRPTKSAVVTDANTAIKSDSSKKRKREDGPDTTKSSSKLTKAEPTAPVTPQKGNLTKPSRPGLPPSKQSREAPKFKRTSQEDRHPVNIPYQPIQFSRRVIFVNAVFDAVSILNDKVPSTAKACRMSKPELNAYAVELERDLASTKGTSYEMGIKLKIAQLKKSSVEQWLALVEERDERLQKELEEKHSSENPRGKDTSLSKHASSSAAKTALPGPVLRSGLPAKLDCHLLQNFIVDQSKLNPHGYVVSLPTSQAIQKAVADIEQVGSRFNCERCSTYFQVFPERRDGDGALTAGGPCHYHAGRKRWLAARQNNERIWSCCDKSVDSPGGCVTHESHVFRHKDPAALASVWHFENTPEDSITGREAVLAACFDCEMVYTTRGLELARLTALSWPDNIVLIDILVRPIGQIIDFNTKYSGITSQIMSEAEILPREEVYGSKTVTELQVTGLSKLKILQRPEHARHLMHKLISPSTILIGHAIENDLNTMRMIHPKIVDTVIEYPHPRGPLPLRSSLRLLAEKVLCRVIQDEESGHDSREDAVATADLMRIKVSEQWDRMRRIGWGLDGDQLRRPQ